MILALVAALAISLLSAVGIVFYGERSLQNRMHRLILPIAIGVFIGIVFFELIPETLEASHAWGPVAILVGFFGFYLLSHYLETYHQHHTDDHANCGTHSARLLLIGDAIHNIADGIVLASAFMISPFVGIFTALGIALHEIPQEIAEFGILLRAGYSRKRALFYNFVSATSIFWGVLLTLIFAQALEDFLFVLTGLAAGNLLYIAAGDLIPELRHSHRDHFYRTFCTTVITIAVIGILVHYTHLYIGG